MRRGAARMSADAARSPHGSIARLRCSRRRGTLTLIWRADGLADVLGALGGGFGGIAVLPVHPKPEGRGDPHPGARRQGQPRAARPAPAARRSTMRTDDRAREAEAILRGGVPLPMTA